MYKSLFFLLGLISINLNAQTFTLKSNDIDGQATMKQVFDGFGCTDNESIPR